MARIRTIKPDFWTDSLLVQLPHFVRLLYIALWNAADDHGYVRDEPDRIAMEVMPREHGAAVDQAIQLLSASGRLEWFVGDDGASFYRIAKWQEHQKVDHPAKSRIFRESSRKVAIPAEVRRAVATKYGCLSGEEVPAECFYCGAPGSVSWFRHFDGRPSTWVVFPGLELDHLEAEYTGGETTSENIVLACRRCNRGKGHKHWFDFLSSRNFAKPREDKRNLAPDLVPSTGEGKGSRKQASREEPTKPPSNSNSADPSAGALRVGIVKAFEDIAKRHAPDTGRAEVWLAQGRDPKITLAVVRECIGKNPKMRSLAYCDDAIAEAHEKRSSARPTASPDDWLNDPAEVEKRQRGILQIWARLTPLDRVGGWNHGWDKFCGGPPGDPRCRVPPQVLADLGIETSAAA